ncbi:MAG: hypothetical protein FWC09_02860, partial [Lachnospiraceae bacterium]|nr:hypothetical protein [Lachnospiraceae bacterium]
MKRRTKEKEIMKAVSVCALSIALFGAAFIGFNQLIFAAETNEVTPLPSATEAVVVSQKTEQVKTEALAEAKTFMAPVLKLIESPEQYRHPIPASAMSMQEAAQIGARYIWDVFDAGIDGMYIQMLYAAHVSQSSTWWFGTVYMEDPENPTQNYLVDVRGVEKLALPIYSFTINAVTGERIDISYMDNTAELTNLYSDSDSIINARMGLV